MKANKKKMPTKVGFISLGCPKNLCDTEVMLRHLVDAGYEITPEDTEADIIVINTCAFLESAKSEAIDNILDVAWLKEHRSLRGIVVTGCLPERYRDEIFSEMPEVDALVGVGSVHEIVDAVRAVENGKKFSAYGDKNEAALGGERVVTTDSYAYLKIAEGCDNRCTYCAIPDIRGCHRSRPMEDIIAEAKSLEELGIGELIIVAQDTTRYGIDIYGEYKLAELLRRLSEETKIPWLRILYCYPDKITDELIATIRDNDRVVKYIDLPIQHVSDSVLRRMNRHGGEASVRDAVARLRREVEGITIRTTAIVGFPGETEEEFSALCEYVKEAKFDRFGAFTYSREEGTPAYDFEDQIDEQTKQDRLDRIMAIQLDVTAELNAKKLGKVIDVIYEGYDYVSDACFGRSEADAPEIDGKVYFDLNEDERPREGEHIRVKITETLDYDLVGTVCKAPPHA